MISDFYSYSQELDDEDLISYYFMTANGSLYYVYFDPYQYDGYTSHYPNLLNKGYGFGFHRAAKSSGWVKDVKIENTISKIVFDFFNEMGSDIVLLYHCDYADDKQKGRDKIFNNWYDSSILKEYVIKERIMISIAEKEEVNEYYMGYLTSISNKNKESVSQEFTEFAENLLISK